MRALPAIAYAIAVPPVVWRAHTGFVHGDTTSAADVVRHEETMRGRSFDLAPALLDMLADYHAASLTWVTFTREDALHYGDLASLVELNLDIPAYVLATDDAGGFLLFFPDDFTSSTGGAAMADLFANDPAAVHDLAEAREKARERLASEIAAHQHEAAALIGVDDHESFLQFVQGEVKAAEMTKLGGGVAPHLPQLEEEDEQKKRAGRGGGGDMGNPANASLAANIRPDVVAAPGGLQTVTTAKSVDYDANPQATTASEYLRDLLARAQQSAPEQSDYDRLIDPENVAAYEHAKYARRAADEAHAELVAPFEDIPEFADTYLLHAAAGIRAARLGLPEYPVNSAVAGIHFDLERTLSALPPQTDKPPYMRGGGSMIDPYTIADWVVDGSPEANFAVWGDSPLEAAMLRNAIKGGHAAAPADVPNDAAFRSHPLPYLSLADLENPWNAVEMPLHPDADPLLRAGALHAACYCAAGEYELMRLIRAGEYVPPFYQPDDPNEIGMHEYAEGSFGYAEAKVDKMLLSEYRDIETLRTAEAAFATIAAIRGIEPADTTNSALSFRTDRVAFLEGVLEERDAALTVMRQNDEIIKRQEDERRAEAGETPTPEVVTTGSSYLKDLLSRAQDAKPDSDDRELVDHDHGKGPTPTGGGRGMF